MHSLRDGTILERLSSDIHIMPNGERWLVREHLLNKCSIFIRSQTLRKICDHSQKGALYLAEIQHRNGHGDHMGRSLPQLCSDQPHATFTLRQSESALHFHALTLIPVVLSLVSGFSLPGATQCRTGEPDTVCLAIVEVLAVSVDFVRQDPIRLG